MAAPRGQVIADLPIADARCDNLPMAKDKPAPETPDSTDADLATELASAKTRIEVLEGDLRYVTANRDRITVERQAMWRDYCRLREVLLKAFPEIADPAAKQAVTEALAAGQSP
jgi:hypothetical protein